MYIYIYIYFEVHAGWSDLKAENITPNRKYTDPMYVVYARKEASEETSKSEL